MKVLGLMAGVLLILGLALPPQNKITNEPQKYDQNLNSYKGNQPEKSYVNNNNMDFNISNDIKNKTYIEKETKELLSSQTKYGADFEDQRNVKTYTSPYSKKTCTIYSNNLQKDKKGFKKPKGIKSSISTIFVDYPGKKQNSSWDRKQKQLQTHPNSTLRPLYNHYFNQSPADTENFQSVDFSKKKSQWENIKNKFTSHWSNNNENSIKSKTKWENIKNKFTQNGSYKGAQSNQIKLPAPDDASTIYKGYQAPEERQYVKG